MKTLVIVSHPIPEQSVVIRALESVASNLPGVRVRNLETLYGHDTQAFNIQVEQEAYADVDRVVYLFPIHWFNLTPMLKAYLNQVWSYGWAFGPNGEALKGKTMQLVVSAGATEYTYSATGLIESSMGQVLTPMKASALYVGMQYAEPMAIYQSMAMNAERLDSVSQQFLHLLAPAI